MKIRIQNDAPKSVKCYMKEMKSLCGSEQTLCKIFMSNKVQILLERYPGIKKFPKRIVGQKKDRIQLQRLSKQTAKVYWQILSHLQDFGGSKFQVPYQYRQQRSEYSCQVPKSISHINFEGLKELLLLSGSGIVSIESIAFLSMPSVEKIMIDQDYQNYETKSLAKTNFNRLKVLHLSQSKRFSYEKTSYLNRARFNMIEKEEEKIEYSDEQEEEIKQLRTIMKESSFAKHLIRMSVKIPCNKLDYSMFNYCSSRCFAYESKALRINIRVQKLVPS